MNRGTSEKKFLGEIRVLSERLRALATPGLSDGVRRRRRQSLVKWLVKDNQLLDLAAAIALHVDAPESEDVACILLVERARIAKEKWRRRVDNEFEVEVSSRKRAAQDREGKSAVRKRR